MGGELYGDALVEKLLDGGRLLAWRQIAAYVRAQYEMQEVWGKGGKAWECECRFRRGGKTLCGLYARTGEFGFMVIFGRAEQAAFDARRSEFTDEIVQLYKATKTYHDGKWMMVMAPDGRYMADIQKLLEIKRKPKKQ